MLWANLSDSRECSPDRTGNGKLARIEGSARTGLKEKEWVIGRLITGPAGVETPDMT